MAESWVIVRRADGVAVMETYNPRLVAALNTEAYAAVPTLAYLYRLNAAIKARGGHQPCYTAQFAAQIIGQRLEEESEL